MIGSQPNLTPQQATPRVNPFADMSGLAPPRKLQDQTVQAAANNAMAQGYQQGYVRPATQTKAGFSVNARDKMRAAQQQAQGMAEGAQAAAGIQADADAFNYQQDQAAQQRQESRLIANRQQGIQANQANFGSALERQSAYSDYLTSQQRGWNSIRLALLSKLA